MAFGINFGPAEKSVINIVHEVADKGEQLVKNTIDDAKAIFQDASVCLAKLDDVRIRLANRQLEYSTAIVQVAVDNIYPLIEQAWQQVEGSLKQDPNPLLFMMIDPHEFYHGNGNSPFREINDVQSLDRALSFASGRSKRVLMFVHGMGYTSTGSVFAVESSNGLIEHFEGQAGIYANGKRDDICLLFVMYNSDLTQNQKNVIAAAAATILQPLGPVLSDAIAFGIMWRELERRAKLVAQSLRPYFEHIIVNKTDYKLRAVTNSLGSYVWSELMDGMGTDGIFTSKANRGPAGAWWSMQAAVPANAYTRTGVFPRALEGYLSDGVFFADIWYSHFDIVLSTAYLYAKQAPAMGQFGAGNIKSLRQIDVSALAGTSHSESVFQGVGGYFEKIGPTIRQEIKNFLN